MTFGHEPTSSYDKCDSCVSAHVASDIKNTLILYLSILSSFYVILYKSVF